MRRPAPASSPFTPRARDLMKLAGFGLGLRTPHYEAVLDEPHAIDWLEVITENYLGAGGKPLHYLERIRERYPLVMHGVSLICVGPELTDATCTISCPYPTPKKRCRRW